MDALILASIGGQWLRSSLVKRGGILGLGGDHPERESFIGRKPTVRSGLMRYRENTGRVFNDLRYGNCPLNLFP